MSIEAIIENMSKAMAKERSETQMTLSELIHEMEKHDPDTKVVGISAECDSYRGYYSDLAFEAGESTTNKVLEVARNALGKTFEGYKGGDFTMTKITPLFVASYGCCGDKLMGFEVVDGSLVAITDEDD